MPKNRTRKGALPPAESVRRASSMKRRAAAALAACVALAGAAAALWAPVWRAPAPPSPSAPAQQANPALSKEYIYAGGRLVATEEPAPPASGPVPTDLAAAPASATSVTVTWSPPPGTIASYTVERAQSVSGPFAPLSPATTDTVFTDTTAFTNTAYLYRVKATFTGGGSSPYSNVDLATTVAFSDDPIQAGSTVVRAAHLLELRGAVDAVRALAGLGGAAWQTNPAPAQGGALRASHFAELRDQLNPALSALGLAQLPNDPTLAAGQPVKAAHLQGVREKVK